LTYLAAIKIEILWMSSGAWAITAGSPFGAL
jgi:hypothetical protein